MHRYAILPSPLGDLLVVGDGRAITGLWTYARPVGDARRDDGAFAEAATQLAEYFAGRRTAFDLALAPAGTPFQQRVWQQLLRIPYGETIDYRELARRCGRPGAARAVGRANATNPISIVVPCHRVVGAGGALTGYSGGLERKRALLDLESQAKVTPVSP